MGPGFFTATDTDKDGSLTRAEFKGTFAKWFSEWDTDKSGSLDETKLGTGCPTRTLGRSIRGKNRPRFGRWSLMADTRSSLVMAP